MTTSQRTSQSARNQRVLESCRETVHSYCAERLGKLFEQAGTALLDFAERAESNALQGRFFEAITLLQQRRSKIEQIFRLEIDLGFEQMCRAEAADASSDDEAELSLVEPDVMEESVATENIVIKTNANCFPELFALSQRLAVISGGRKLKDFQIPGGPHNLVHAFQHAISGLDLEMKIKIVLYALFDKHVTRSANTLYHELNAGLKAEGILPNIRPISVRKGKARLHRQEDARQQQQTEQDEADAGSLGGELFGSILELMSSRRGGKEVKKRAGSSKPISRDNVVAAFAKLPDRPAGNEPAADDALGIDGVADVSIDEAFVHRVKETLEHEREQVLDALDRDKLAPVDADLIDLIGMLFEYMLNDPVLPNSAKALISHLHTPYLKVALIDRRLLVNTNHPARRLLDVMVEAGALWVEESNPNRGIFPQIQRVVDRVQNEFTDNVELFDELLAYFEHAMEEQRRRTDTMEQRTQEAVRGRERLQLAKQRASQEVALMIGQHPLPEPASAFLHRTWLDLLTSILLRTDDGESSEAWRKALDTGRQITALFEPGIDAATFKARIGRIPAIQASIAAGIRTLGSHNHAVLEGMQSVLAAPQVWRQRLEGHATEGAAPHAATHQHRIEQLRRGADALVEDSDGRDLDEEERAMVERLRKTKFGTWFELTPEGGGRPRRIKLSWMSLLTSTCMFVDRSGMQAELKTLHELAREMLAGRAKIIPRQPHPFIERAMVSIRKVLTQDPSALSQRSPPPQASGPQQQ